jgi:DNA-binding HxlR family transcriptional regulator
MSFQLRLASAKGEEHGKGEQFPYFDVQPRITQRMPTKELRELEKDGLVIRKVYPQIPPKVEYSLTETAQTLIPILDQLCDWGSEHMGDDIEFKCEE